MKSLIIKIVALLVCFINIATLQAASFKINGLYYETEGNEAFVTGYDTSQGENVIIPESVSYEGTTYIVTKINSLAFYSHHGVSSVLIPNTVTTIEGSAFIYAGLTTLTIPKSVTSIGKCAFTGCSSLKSINVENGNPKYDSRDYCNAIIETDRDELFQGCQNTVFPSSVKTIADMAFYMCSCPENLVIPDNITLIGDRAFSDCNTLKSITLGRGLTFIGGIETFGGCSYLESVTSLAINPPDVWSESCFDSISYETVILKVSAESANAYKEASCWSKFKTISNLNRYDFEVDGIYYNIVSSNTVEVTHDDHDNGSYNMPNVIIPESVSYEDKNYTVTAIGDSAFYHSNVTNVTLPQTITTIGKDAFKNCSLENLTCLASVPPTVNDSFNEHHPWDGYLPCLDQEGYEITPVYLLVEAEAYQRYVEEYSSQNYFSCIAIIGAGKTLPPAVEGSYDYSHGRTVSYSVSILEGEPSTIYSNYGLYSTQEPYYNDWSCENHYSTTAIYQCISTYMSVVAFAIADGKLPSDRVEISNEDGVQPELIEGGYDFEESGIYYKYIDNNELQVTCPRLYDPCTWVSGEDYNYEDCIRYAGELTIPSEVNGQKVTSIDFDVFYHCDELISIVLPETMMNMGDSFSNCPNLTSIISLNPTPPENAYFDHDIYENVVLYVPVIALSDYQYAEGWSGFKTIKALDNYDYDFVIDGIYYRILNNNEVMLVVGENTYHGDLILPSEVSYEGYNYAVVGIDDYAFYNSTLNSLTIPVTINSIANHAFTGCNINAVYISGDGEWYAGAIICEVESLSIGVGVTKIEGLNVSPAIIYSYESTPPVCDENTFIDYNAVLHVPAASLASYYTAPYWSNFAHIVGDAVPITDLLVDQSNLILLVGNQTTTHVSINPVNAMPNSISWHSTDEYVAAVDNGVITAIGCGECNITATCQNKQIVCHVTVVDHPISISLDKHEITLLPNHLATINVTVTPMMSTILVVTSSNPSVATTKIVDGGIQVVGISEGETTIYVNTDDGCVEPDSCQIIVKTELGDVNCDGFTDIADVIEIIDYVLTGNHTLVKPCNADIDQSGNIDISDVTGLIDIILEKNETITNEIKTFTVNGVSFNMVHVTGGYFMMGGTDEQGNDVYDNEFPVHKVTLSDYSIGQTEVTQALWEAVMGSNPSSFTGDLSHPVEKVSWNNCQVFITKLNELTGKSFRLPTEAEYEYAARGGNRSKGYKYAGSNDINDVAWYSGNADSMTHPVGTKCPNELGIYDMNGNVWEWCQDWYGNYSGDDQTDPVGASTGSSRVTRGGGWGGGPRDCRIAIRGNTSPSISGRSLGLRLAL